MFGGHSGGGAACCLCTDHQHHLWQQWCCKEPMKIQRWQRKCLLLWMLQRVMGQLKRAERTGNRSKQRGFFQSKTWILSCLAHVADTNQVDKIGMSREWTTGWRTDCRWWISISWFRWGHDSQCKCEQLHGLQNLHGAARGKHFSWEGQNLLARF